MESHPLRMRGLKLFKQQKKMEATSIRLISQTAQGVRPLRI